MKELTEKVTEIELGTLLKHPDMEPLGENILRRLAFERDQLLTVPGAMNVIKQAMIDDTPSEPGSLAHGWHCNIAMMCLDALRGNEFTAKALWGMDLHVVINDSASRFMKICFGVDTKA